MLRAGLRRRRGLRRRLVLLLLIVRLLQLLLLLLLLRRLMRLLLTILLLWNEVRLWMLIVVLLLGMGRRRGLRWRMRWIKVLLVMLLLPLPCQRVARVCLHIGRDAAVVEHAPRLTERDAVESTPDVGRGGRHWQPARGHAPGDDDARLPLHRATRAVAAVPAPRGTRQNYEDRLRAVSAPLL